MVAKVEDTLVMQNFQKSNHYNKQILVVSVFVTVRVCVSVKRERERGVKTGS